MRRGQPDFVIFLVTLALVGLGLIMVFSASMAKANELYGDAAYFFKRQFLWALLGGAAMLVTMRVDYRRYRELAGPLLLVTVILLLVVLLPGVGREVHGSRRWLGFGSLGLQPSELAKLAVVVYAAVGLARRPDQVGRFVTGILPWIALISVLFLLVLQQPDLGTAIAIAGSLFFLLFMAGARLGHLGALVAAALPVLAWAVVSAEYRLRRLIAHLRPFDDPLGSGFHIIQSLYALGTGRIFGVGLGQSVQKYFYLPEQHTDFIFAILGEELGLIGGLVVILLFVVFAWRGYRAALTAPDTLGCLLAAGMTTMVVLQAVINIGVVTATLPITGIPLPFVSFGGNSLLFSMMGVGVLLNVSRYGKG
ncbi:MAG: putative lipid II flippase FtsW [bacterium]|nr:putative lipid II flippase FtsW [bacterium]